jgi:SAM-dependent methyltransferase
MLFKKTNKLNRQRKSGIFEYRNQLGIAQNIRWSIGSISVEQKLVFSGWALYENGNSSTSLPIFLNNNRVKEIAFPLDSPNLEGILPDIKNSSQSGFKCEIERSLDELFNNDFVELKFMPYGLTHSQIARNAFYYYDPRKERKMPDTKNIYRVIGSKNIEGFLFSGATAFLRISNYLEDHIGRPLSSFSSVLDWGCGAGRLTRYLTLENDCSITGADIDKVNIDWCKLAIENAEFEHIGLRPKTKFADNSFDLIIGISVFTHLREPDQNAWLRELKRIVKPDGIIMVSYHGPTVMGLVKAKEPLLQKIENDGFCITGENRQIDNLDEDNYYVNVSHSQWYIEKMWGQYLEILDIVPALLGRQDMVVMSG